MHPQPQETPFPVRLRQMRDAGVAFAMFPALTIMLFLRTRLGFRVLSLGALFGTAFFLYVLNGIGNFHIALPLVGRFGAARPSESLRDFALLFLALGLWERRKRWKELLEGARWHTRSRGISRLEFLPIRTEWVYRYIDPAVAFTAGLCIKKAGFSGLGLWIMFGAICLRWVEEYSRDRQLELDLDSLDTLLESDVAGATVAHFEGESKSRSLRDTGGIPTGADAALSEAIAPRKAGVRP